MASKMPETAWRKARNHVGRLFAWIDSLSLVPHALAMTALCFAVRMVMAIVLVLSFHTVLPDGGLEISLSRDVSLFDALIAAPAFETVLLQWLPTKLTSSLTRDVRIHMLVSAALFGLVHMELGTPFAANLLIVSNAAVVGWLLVRTFLLWQGRGRYRGFVAAALVHSLSNAVAFGLRQFLPMK